MGFLQTLQANFPLTVAAVVVVAVPILLVLLKKRKPRARAALNPAELVDLKLVERFDVSHDTRRFRFALPAPDMILGLPVGQHVSFQYSDAEGKLVVRSYTPTTSDDEVGFVDFVVKVYFKNVHPKFPDGGKMSQHLESLKIGDNISVRGPKGKLTYLGRGRFTIKESLAPGAAVSERNVRRVGMIAGGSGITPMLQIMNAMYKDNADRTDISMLFANQTENDILLREALDSLHATKGLKLWYTIDRTVLPGWNYSVGYISEAMLREHLPPPGDDTLILVCGPPAMWEFAVKPNLEKIGFTANQIYVF